MNLKEESAEGTAIAGLAAVLLRRCESIEQRVVSAIKVPTPTFLAQVKHDDLFTPDLQTLCTLYLFWAQCYWKHRGKRMRGKIIGL